MLIMVCGLPGTGKSFFASRLASLLGAVHLNTDILRKQMLQNKTYTNSEKLIVYEQMAAQAEKNIRAGEDVVVDGTFYQAAIRKMFTQLAEKCNTMFYMIRVTAEENTIKKRVEVKRPDSDADFAVYKKIKELYDPILEPHLTIESKNDNIDEMLTRGRKYLSL